MSESAVSAAVEVAAQHGLRSEHASFMISLPRRPELRPVLGERLGRLRAAYA